MTEITERQLLVNSAAIAALDGVREVFANRGIKLADLPDLVDSALLTAWRANGNRQDYERLDR